MEKKVVFFVTNEFRSLYRFRLDIISSYMNRGVEIHLLGKFDGHEKLFKNLGIDYIYDIPFNGREISFKSIIISFYRLFRIYEKFRPDFSFQYTIKPCIYGSLISKLFRIPNIIMITGVSFFLLKKSLLSKIAIPIMRYAYSDVQEIFFTNEKEKSLFKNLKILNKQEYSVIPGAGFVENNISSWKSKRKLINFLMVGRVVKEKGVLEFLSVAEKYSNNNISFTLVGEHNDNKSEYIEKDILMKNISNKNISYYNFTDDIEMFYQSASCLILPSYKEGISTVILEAISYGVPVITTNVTGCIDIIPNESHGFLCSPHNVKSLELAVEKYLKTSDKDLNILKTNAYNRAKNKFSRKKILQKYENILRTFIYND